MSRFLSRWVGIFTKQSNCRHDLSWRAVAALCAVALGNALLDRVVLPLRGADALAGRDLLPVAREERAEARVDGLVFDGAGGLVHGREHHRACAAAALLARRLGAGPEGQQRGVGQ